MRAGGFKIGTKKEAVEEQPLLISKYFLIFPKIVFKVEQFCFYSFSFKK